MKIERIDERSPHLDTVKALADANRNTLGFLPEGAFDAYAAQRRIAVAVDDDKQCVGYLMYRVCAARSEVAIIQLCVEPRSRRASVGTALVEWLRTTTRRDYRGITLRCRRDYAANQFWPRVGFVAQGEVAGRQGVPRTVWRLDHGHPSLFSAPAEALREARLPVVLDANCVFDLQDVGEPAGEQTRALLADWLSDEVVLSVTDEVFNEIDRNDDAAERQRRRAFADQFQRFSTYLEQVRRIAQRVRLLWPEHLSDSDESDARQLAHTVVADVPFFVTRDDYMLAPEFANRVYADFGVSIIRPSDLVIRLDELLRGAAYQPARLAGSRVQVGRLTAGDIDDLDVFRESALGERKGGYREALHRFLADPRKTESLIVRDSGGQPLALTVVTRPHAGELLVPLFRVLPNSLESTLTTHIGIRHVSAAIGEKRLITRITDEHLRGDVQSALREVGYLRTGDAWVKISLPIVASARDIAEAVRNIPERSRLTELSTAMAEALETAAANADTGTMLRAERALWPAKVTDLDIPAYIVPIRPVWAKHLLGEEPGQPSLFGTDPTLALSWVNAYYRAPRGTMEWPSRVLWYVSHDRDDPASKRVRGCSMVEDVLIDVPKEVFRRFRQLGVYQWPDVLAVAKGDAGKPVMAFRFGHTELFDEPVPWDTLQEVLKAEEGKHSQIVTVTSISPRCFFRLYELGRGMR